MTVISGEPSSGDSPIYIVGDGDFTPANGVTSGSGTADDSYIIENKNISTVGGTDGIVIINTTAYFIIRNSYVHGGGDEIGIYFIGVVNGKIENCIIVNNEIGIDLAPSTSLSKNNTLINNTCKNNNIGIHLGRSGNNLISNNTCEKNRDGIHLSSSSSNLLENNTLSNNSSSGVSVGYSSDSNLIINNTYENNDDGIGLRKSYNNIIYHNNFINNTNQVYIFESSNNYWDNGYPSGGNYWSDYAGEDADVDGIGDTPYEISGDNNQDRYPLMNPV